MVYIGKMSASFQPTKKMAMRTITIAALAVLMIFAAITTFVPISRSDNIRDLQTSEEDSDHDNDDQDLELPVSKAFS